jgi:predicted DCC family thiol-disulfide oxidoreductase YuxK
MAGLDPAIREMRLRRSVFCVDARIKSGHDDHRAAAGVSISRPPEPALVVYDGECIFCRNFARLLRLRDSVGPVELLDARSGDPRVLAYQRQGYDLNQGMLFVWQGRVYHAAAAMQMLAALTTPVSWFNRLAAALFSRPVPARLLYPVLNGGRMLTLLLRGKGLIKLPPAL